MARAYQEDATARRRGQLKLAGWAVAIVVLVIGFIVLAKLVSGAGGGSTASGTTTAPASVLTKINALSPSLFAQVGQGSVANLPKAIAASPLTAGGKPQLVYIGAEYCPYCAAERWAMVIALSHFGTFSNLQETHSSTIDTDPNTQTFSFHGTSYTSSYITFTGVETNSNVVQGSGYATLDTPTASEQALLTTYDAPPYVSTDSAGAIPFIDFGGAYIISGSTYDPGVLQGKSYDQILSALTSPKSAISQGVLGSANVITAAICKMTNNQPANVCTTTTIKNLESQLGS